jgi:two-component system sensor histidine kinase DegS
VLKVAAEQEVAELMSDAELSAATDMTARIIEAQEAERARLAREIHDGPAAALTNAILQVDIVEKMLGREPVLAAAELRLLRDLLRRELSDVRAFINQLRPPILADLGLEGAIRESAEAVQDTLEIPVSVEIDRRVKLLMESELDDQTETVVLRIVQEALQNVRKHAEATRVTIRAELGEGEWTVDVKDDGRGFNPEAIAARGRRNFGLQFMRERAALIGARFEVRSQPDTGTVVRIAVPREAEETT